MMVKIQNIQMENMKVLKIKLKVLIVLFVMKHSKRKKKCSAIKKNITLFMNVNFVQNHLEIKKLVIIT